MRNRNELQDRLAAEFGFEIDLRIDGEGSSWISGSAPHHGIADLGR